MKRALCIILMAALLFSHTAGGMSEQTLYTDYEIDPNTRLSSSAFLGGMLYLTCDGGFFSYASGDDELKELEVDDRRTDSAEILSSMGPTTPSYDKMRLFTEDDRLYALDMQESGMIYPLSIEGDHLVLGDGVSIDIEPLFKKDIDDARYPEQPSQMVGFNGRLYLIEQTWTELGIELNLLSYDLKKGGEAVRHKNEHIWALAPYQDGKLLALVMDDSNSWNEKMGKTKNFMLCLYDPQKDSLNEYADSGVGFMYGGSSLCYNAQNDAIYIRCQSEVYRYKSPGKAEPACNLPPTQPEESTSEGLYPLSPTGIIAVRDNSIAVRETDPAKVHAKQLTIFGAYLMDDVHQQTIRDMNGVSVYSLPTAFFSSAREMAQSLVSGEDGIDILSIRSNFIDVKKLMNKGYSVDLSANRALRDYVSSLYPSIGEIGQYDGKLFMVPVYLGPNSVLSYFTKPFELVQDDAALPATYDELIDLIQRWNDELVDLYPDIVPMLNSDYKVQMVNLAITLYKDASAMQGNEFDFKDPILMRMLERALTLRTENIYAKVDPASPDTQARLDELYGKMPLFTSDWTWFDLDSLEKPLNNNDDGTMISAQTGSGMGEAGFALPLQLTIGKGEKPVTSINLTLLAVNPRSKNIDTAIEYIEKFIQNISPSQRVMMNPNMNDPIPNPEYEQEVIWRALHLAAIKEELKTALGAKKTELEQNYESTKQAYRLNSVKIKYTLHQETIDLYRRLVANSYITLFSHNTGLFGDDMTILRRRLTDGQISLEQFVNEANGKLRLKRLEGQ